MSFSAIFSDVNFLAVLVATVLAFVIGGLWYSPVLFYKAWLDGAGLTEEQAQQGHPGKIYGGAFAMTFVAATLLAVVIGDHKSLIYGIHWGLIVGIGWVSTSFATNYLFERRSFKLWLVNAGYNVVLFTVMGAVIGMW
ncbi:MAG: DUF1761 domain-containing protein [Gammaproteobacteria bacterium]|nr:DUF1761 domain-containing protein [Gammaproteobacteria bacterium]